MFQLESHILKSGSFPFYMNWQNGNYIANHIIKWQNYMMKHRHSYSANKIILKNPRCLQLTAVILYIICMVCMCVLVSQTENNIGDYIFILKFLFLFSFSFSWYHFPLLRCNASTKKILRQFHSGACQRMKKKIPRNEKEFFIQL